MHLLQGRAWRLEVSVPRDVVLCTTGAVHSVAYQKGELRYGEGVVLGTARFPFNSSGHFSRSCGLGNKHLGRRGASCSAELTS